MIKYVYDYKVTFAEIPDEISMCYSITNCAGLCDQCHSPWLRNDIGQSLSEHIMEDIEKESRYGITCVCLLGEGLKQKNSREEIVEIFKQIKTTYPHIKTALYSGRDEMDPMYDGVLDYYKIGHYRPDRGPLNNPETNQQLFKREGDRWVDITSRFWR